MSFNHLNPLRLLNKAIPRTVNKLQSSIFTIPVLIVILICTLQVLGLFQLLELKFLDKLFQLRTSEGLDSRIVMVTFDDRDLARVGRWPFPDNVVAKLITQVKAGNPRVIGLDVYRNLPVEPGFDELKKVFQATPNLIVAEKFVNPSVLPPPYIDYKNQVGFVDTVVDQDGTVRRGLLSIEKPNGEIIYSFSIKIALNYLASKGITPDTSSDKDHTVVLGKSRFTPLGSHQTGYGATDNGGYQILLNYRCQTECFQEISMTNVLDGKYPQNLFENRIVLIGSTAESLRDFFFSPYGSIPGVHIHANLISQIINGAINNRPFLQTYPKWVEGIWVLIWASIGVAGISSFLRGGSFVKAQFFAGILTFLVISMMGLVLISYISFLFSFWLSIFPALSSFLLSSVISIIQLGEKFRYASNIDELTQIANRRYFDRFLMKNFQTKQDLCVLICDVDHFKLYNDSYGHQDGDKCLQLVAQAINKSVRSGELAGRYGGEEFAVILPNTSYESALAVAERIVVNVRSLNIPHKSSMTNNVVTLSCGVACMESEDISSLDLLIKADRALYKAKEQGRNRAIGYKQ
ncbi:MULTISPECIES: CHASE2 domain-containing protein [Pseudanabaena]|jgi:adenylate cyclase|uniref:CHASE2 domain-containing protein n=1 Tax=Pseudanabaena TaxID=1152 RepID=UPI00247884DF|nr:MULTISPECIES: CHASE2 domain-containing protein [Pseudanabaena]MEA5487674.1 CHASE2 domain-containing protein [Pseudanabaena sp. CCNP1317]WGS70855.1 CHASE2 domain-containing protein [Pseudanabaena galeata CCNP1313]